METYQAAEPFYLLDAAASTPHRSTGVLMLGSVEVCVPPAFCPLSFRPDFPAHLPQTADDCSQQVQTGLRRKEQVKADVEGKHEASIIT